MLVIDINAFMLSLDYDKMQSLFILLDKRGLIVRMGNGRIDNTDFLLYTGKIDEPLFQELLNNITDDMLEFTGDYSLENQGVPCELVIMLYSNGENRRFRFSYGSQFNGLPGEIYNLISEAIKLTDPWYLKAQTTKDKKPHK